MNILLANILVVIGIIFTSIGILGLFRFKSFYLRLLASANADTVGMLFIFIGMLFVAPNKEFAFKLLIIIGLSVITTPLSTHAIARSAYISGYRQNR